MLGVALEFKDYPDTTTPYTATTMNNMQKLLVSLVYPVGSYYETSDSNFDPNTAWGGTWELDQSGTVLVSKSSSSSSKFNASIGTVVGEEEHTLTESEIPPLNCYAPVDATGGNIAYLTNYDGYTGSGIGSTPVAKTKDSTAISHNNIQPSKIVNRWHRTA